MNIKLSSLLTTASWREAARLRAAEVDLEHLYLGLIAVGGSAARLLGRHGTAGTKAGPQRRKAVRSHGFAGIHQLVASQGHLRRVAQAGQQHRPLVVTEGAQDIL